MSDIYLQPSEIHTHQQHTKGKLIGQKPPLKPKEVWSIRALLQLNEKELTTPAYFICRPNFPTSLWV